MCVDGGCLFFSLFVVFGSRLSVIMRCLFVDCVYSNTFWFVFDWYCVFCLVISINTFGRNYSEQKCSYKIWSSVLFRLLLFFFISTYPNIYEQNVNLLCKCWCQIAGQTKNTRNVKSHWSEKTGPVFCCCVVMFEFGRGKKWRVAVWSVCLIYMRNKNQSPPLSHPFTCPATTTLLMILCIIQKQFGRLCFREIVVLTHNQSTSDVCQ